MGFSLWNLFEAGLLVINAIAILHEERFLAKMGWGRHQTQQINQQHTYGHAPSEPGLKANILNLIHSIRTVMRVPLIALNICVVLFKLVAG